MSNITVKYLTKAIMAVFIIIIYQYNNLCFSGDKTANEVSRSTLTIPSFFNGNLPAGKGLNLPMMDIKTDNLSAKDTASGDTVPVQSAKNRVSVYFASLEQAKIIISEHLSGNNDRSLLLIKNIPREIYFNGLYPPFYREKKQLGIIEPTPAEISGYLDMPAGNYLADKIRKAKLVVLSSEHSLLSAVRVSLFADKDIVFISDCFIDGALKQYFIKLLQAVSAGSEGAIIAISDGGAINQGQ